MTLKCNRIQFSQDSLNYYDVRYFLDDRQVYRRSMRTGDALNLMDTTKCPFSVTTLEGKTVNVG